MSRAMNPPVDREYVDEYFKSVFKLLGQHTATWDGYIQANELEKRMVWAELDSIRRELNMELKRDKEVFRGPTVEQEYFITE